MGGSDYLTWKVLLQKVLKFIKYPFPMNILFDINCLIINHQKPDNCIPLYLQTSFLKVFVFIS